MYLSSFEADETSLLLHPPFRHLLGIARSESDGTWWRTGGEVKGKYANGVGSRQFALYRKTVYPPLLPLMRTHRLPAAD